MARSRRYFPCDARRCPAGAFGYRLKFQSRLDWKSEVGPNTPLFGRGEMSNLRRNPQRLTDRQARCVVRNLKRMELMVEIFGRRAKLRHFEILAAVYEHEPATRKEVCGAVEWTENLVITDLLFLGIEGHRGKRGLGLVSWHWAGITRPHLQYTVTPYGLQVLERFAALEELGPDSRCGE